MNDKIYPTRAQLETLLREFETCSEDDYYYAGLYLIHVENEYMVVTVRQPHGGVYERMIDKAGKIWRYDVDDDQYVEATAEPMVGTYRLSTIDDRTRTYNY